MFHGLHGKAGELKSQGAAEAAGDPNSQVTSEDAQKTIMEEARASGSAAYHFDPNASAEEKAAAARSNVPAGFHRERKPKVAAIVSDAVSLRHITMTVQVL
jgi:hypothetical protein